MMAGWWPNCCCAACRYAIASCGNIASAPGVTDITDRYDYAADSWTSRTANPVAVGTTGGGAETAGFQGHCIGGFAATDADSKKVNAYNNASDTWSNGPDYPVGIYVNPAVEDNDEIHSMGGQIRATLAYTSRHDSYDYSSWASKTAIPVAKSRATAGSVGAGETYLFGGGDGGGAIANVDNYDSASDTFSSRTSLSTATADASQLTDHDNLIVIIGGASGASFATLLADVVAYSSSGDSFTTMTTMTTARLLASSASICASSGVVFLGRITGTPLVAMNESFDISADIWSSLTSAPSVRRGAFGFDAE